MWVPVRDVVREQTKTQTVYNFEVEEDNSYVANSYGVHNCCDYSLAGKRKGFSSFKDHLGNICDCAPEESRGMLYLWMCKAVQIANPLVLIAENVKGLDMMLAEKKQIFSDFESLGYTMQCRVLSAARYGVPQSRERLIFVGVRTDALTEEAKEALDPMAFPFVPMLFPEPFPQTITCRQAFADLSEPPLSLAGKGKAGQTDEEAYSKASYLPTAQGNKEIDLDGQAPTIRAEHHGNIEYRRLSKKHGGRYGRELSQGMIERRLTIRECSRLMAFPDDLRFLPYVSTSEAYRIIGNAVPSVMGWAIGKHLSDKWEFLFGKES